MKNIFFRQKNLASTILIIIMGVLAIGGGIYGWQNYSGSKSPSAGFRAKIRIITSDNAESHFSVYGGDGSLIKTISIPSDFIIGVAGNVQIFGNKIYYTSGTLKKTAIGEIDIETGVARILTFTSTVETSTYFKSGNGLYSILAWTVSDDNSKIAWMDTLGRIMVANMDGSNFKKYDSQLSDKALGSPMTLQFYNNDRDLYYPDGENEVVKRLDLNTGIVGVFLKNLPLNYFSSYRISASGNYYAYVSEDKKLHIKNLYTNTEVLAQQFNDDTNNLLDVGGIIFMSDESKVVLYATIYPERETNKIYIFDILSGKVLSIIDNVELLAVFPDSTKLIFTLPNISPGEGPVYIADINGNNRKQFTTEYFRDITIVK